MSSTNTVSRWLMRPFKKWLFDAQIIKRKNSAPVRYQTCLQFVLFLQSIILLVGQMALLVRQPRPVHASFERELLLNYLWTFPRDTCFILSLSLYLSPCLPSYRFMRGFRNKIPIETKPPPIPFIHIHHILFLNTLFIRLPLYCSNRLLEMNPY
jgi:hypothetical protein